MIEIVIESTDEDTQQLSFEQDSITIGRGLGNDIMLEDPQVSRYHARIVLQGDSLMLYDLRSRNGTRVNSERISSCAISVSDAIYIGQAVLRVRMDGEQPIESFPLQLENGSTNENSPERRDSGFDETRIYTADNFEVEFEEDAPQQRPRRPTKESRVEMLQIATAPPSDEPWRPFEKCLSSIFPLLNDPDIAAITINGPDQILVKKESGIEQTDISLTPGQFQEALRLVVMSTKQPGMSDTSRALCKLQLADGTLISGCTGTVCPEHGLLVIIPNRPEGKDAEALLQQEVFDSEMLFFLHGCVALRKTVLISAPPASDSLSLLRVLASFIPDHQRICLFGPVGMSKLSHTHVVEMTAAEPHESNGLQASLPQLVEVASPDRAVIETPLAGRLCREFVEIAANSCPGSVARIHAISPAAALAKIELEIHRTQAGLPPEAVRQQLYESIDIVAQLAELPNGRQRLVRISEVTSTGGTFSLNDIFLLDRDTDSSKEVILRSPPSFLIDMRVAGFEEAYQAFTAQ